ncbi:unnamed protein product [Caenorhabditis angaria]|uniref:Uncharacterized protein n=1 Tax=Caenorhabditis angaria TaxID=860376 RepID=A0A9P1N1X0_9PELO|nr:unnamed protein product [Caenorhabditis angaria]
MFKNLAFLSICIVSSLARDTKLEKYAKQFSPKTIVEGDHISRQYPKFLMEVTLSFGMNEETTKFIEAVIEKNFNGNLHDLDGMNTMAETIQDMLGGYWSVQIFEDPYIFANTAFRRSSSFVVFDVNKMGIAAIKEG